MRTAFLLWAVAATLTAAMPHTNSALWWTDVVVLAAAGGVFAVKAIKR